MFFDNPHLLPTRFPKPLLVASYPWRRGIECALCWQRWCSICLCFLIQTSCAETFFGSQRVSCDLRFIRTMQMCGRNCRQLTVPAELSASELCRSRRSQLKQQEAGEPKPELCGWQRGPDGTCEAEQRRREKTLFSGLKGLCFALGETKNTIVPSRT